MLGETMFFRSAVKVSPKIGNITAKNHKKGILSFGFIHNQEMSSYLFYSMCHVPTTPLPLVSCLVEIVIVMLGQSANYGWQAMFTGPSREERSRIEEQPSPDKKNTEI
jgi:hypothetical protein